MSKFKNGNKPWIVCLVLLAGAAACSKKGAGPEPEDNATEEAFSGTTAAPAPHMQPSADAWAMPAAQAEEPGAVKPSQVVTGPAEQSGEKDGTLMAGAAALSDGQILMILSGVDAAEVEQAKLAQRRSKNRQVKTFAAHMITQHTKAKRDGEALRRKTRLVPAESSVSADLSAKAGATLDSLKKAAASEFDGLYAQGQVDQHGLVLDMLNTQLLPNAMNPELKSLLETARAMVERHVTEAGELQRSLSEAAVVPPSAANRPSSAL